MDEQKFQKACRLRDKGNLAEAYNEFMQLAESSADDALDKAGALLYASNTLEMSGQYEAALAKLNEARALMEQFVLPKSVSDEKFAALKLFLDFEDANLFWLQGENPQTALNRFEAVLKKHNAVLEDARSHGFYEAIQIRRAFALADLGRCKEALPILEGINSPKDFREGVAFYLGHCYSFAQDFDRAEQKLIEALELGLPTHLEYRAHCELGTVLYNLKNYAKAREEFLKGAEKADTNYIAQSEIWRWLEITCRALGLQAEAERYAQLARPA